MKAIEIVQQLKEENSNILRRIPEKKAANLIRNAWAQIGKRIAETEVGVVKVQGFGNFRVRQVEREKNGQKVTVKRIIFRPIGSRTKDGQQDTE